MMKNNPVNRTVLGKIHYSEYISVSSNTELVKIIGDIFHELVLVRTILEDYYNEDFVLKDQLFKFFYFVKNDLLKVNPLPEDVVKGNNDWMFLGNSYNNVIRNSKAIDLFSKREITLITENLVGKKGWLADQGIGYYVVVAPNKHTVYGDFLSITRSDTISNLHLLKTNLPEDISLIAYDDFPDFGLQTRLFHKTNSHWNDFGAFHSYAALLEQISKQYKDVEIPDLLDYEISDSITYQEDLTRLLDLHHIEKESFNEEN